MYPNSNRKFQFVTPPRAYGATGPVGQEIVLAVSAATGIVLNLGALNFNNPYNSGVAGQSQSPNGVPGNYITIFADGTDIGVIVGLTAAQVSGTTGQPNLDAMGSVNPSGTYTQGTGVCHRIPAGKEVRWMPERGQDLYLGAIGGGTPGVTGFMRVYQSNPPSTGV